MAIELRLAKSPDGGIAEPWGFRLTGGADFAVPLTVVKIVENSPAQISGLQVGDVLLKINEIDLSESTHQEAHNIIAGCELEFNLSIYRGELSQAQNALIAEEQNNEEVYNIMEGSISIDYPEKLYTEEVQENEIERLVIENCFKPEHDLNLTDEDIQNIINPENIQTTLHVEELHLESDESKCQRNGESNSVKIELQSSEETKLQVSEETGFQRDEEITVSFAANLEAEQSIECEIKVEEETGIEVIEEDASVEEEIRISGSVELEEQRNVEVIDESQIDYTQMEACENINIHQEMETLVDTQQDKRDSVIWEAQAKIQQSEVLKAVSDYLSDMEVETRKWSTFLQKPVGPNLILKKLEDAKPKSTYRVVIRTKKDLEEEQAAKKAAEEAAIAAEQAAVEAAIAAEQAAIEAANAEAAMLAEETAQLVIEETLAAAEKIVDDNESPTEIIENIDGEEELSRSDAASKHMSGKEAVLTVEQQLAQVKEQLLALSELPTTIQMTLSVITEQLKLLAQESQPCNFVDDEQSNQDNTETEDEVTELHLESNEALSVVEEESENIRETELEEFVMDEARLQQEDEERLAAEAAEAEQKRAEEAKHAKKEKEQTEQIPWGPMERPIILPGGRKWSQAEDVVRVKNPKLSDEKIDKTISSYYEVITGHTIGINFLKYQPPPKNLDHLQRSEVCKMVHDMDGPSRGIVARPEKIPAVQDYHVQANEEERQVPPQMER